MSSYTTKFDSGFIGNIQKRFIDQAPAVLSKGILTSISRGESPVDSGEWKTPYSDSYLKAIDTNPIFRLLGKKKSPVNLKLTGQLLSSLKIRPNGNKLEVSFTDKLALYHNKELTGRLRRMLPTEDGEVFNKEISLKLNLLLRSVVKISI
jgi:hypothetical protein